MSDSNDWARRVDQMTGATAHEQLRSVVRDATEMLERFTTTAYEQGGLLLDAQREMEVSVAGKIDQISAEMAARMGAIAARLATIEAAQKTMSDFLATVFEVPSAPPIIAAAS